LPAARPAKRFCREGLQYAEIPQIGLFCNLNIECAIIQAGISA